MNVNEPNSGDNTLNSHYQKRKQQHKMPEAVAIAIHAHAQQAKRSRLLTPPIWASTLAACFVIVISIYFMPLEPDFETEAEADYLPAAPLISQSAPVTVQSAPAAKADTQVFNEFSPGNNSGQDSMRMAKASANQALKKPEVLQLKTSGSQLASVAKAKQQAGKAMQERFNYSDANMPDKAQEIAVNGARMSSPALRTDKAEQRSSKQIIAQIKALVGKSNEYQTKQQAVDCDGQILLIDVVHLNNIKANDWVTVYFDRSNKLIHIEKLKQKPKNCNDPTNIK